MHGFDGLELVALNTFDNLFIERRALTRFAERAITREAPSAAGDLGDFVGTQIAPAMAVELAARCERDVIDIHIEAHADGVRRNKEVHLTVLIELHLRIACARAERAHHNSRATAMTAQQFGDRVNFLGRERDDGRALRQLRDLLWP